MICRTADSGGHWSVGPHFHRVEASTTFVSSRFRRDASRDGTSARDPATDATEKGGVTNNNPIA